MNRAVATVPPGDDPKKKGIVKAMESALTEEVVALAKKTYFRGAPDEAIALAFHLCRRYGLDPLAREVMIVPRKIKKDDDSWDTTYTPMVSRDGFLAIAHQNPLFDGMASEIIKDDEGKVIGAKATVFRKDWAHPITEEVFIAEYGVTEYTDKETKQKAVKPASPLWRMKPGTMIKKVAESQALRKAFRIHGVYNAEELDAEPRVAEPTKELPAPKVADQDTVPSPLDTTVKNGPFKGKTWRETLEVVEGRAFWNAAYAVAKDEVQAALKAIWLAWCAEHPEFNPEVAS